MSKKAVAFNSSLITHYSSLLRLMNKENVLFSIIGLLLGLIIGFIFANTVNQRGLQPGPVATTEGTRQNSNLPPDHPVVPSNAVADQEGMQAQVTEQIQ